MPIPANRPISTLKTEVARYVLRPNNTEALSVAVDGINDGIRKINTETWEWGESYTDLTTNSPFDSFGNYTIPSNFQAPRMLQLRDPNSIPNGKLDYYPLKTFNEMFSWGVTSGTPDAYTVRNAQDDSLLTLNTVASASFQSQYPKMRLFYFRRIAYATTDSSTIDAPSDVESFCVMHAQEYIASIYAPEKAMFAAAKAEKWWKDLRSAEMKRQIRDWAGGWRP